MNKPFLSDGRSIFLNCVQQRELRTRITVELVLRKLSEGATTADLLAMYPRLQQEDVIAALMYASEVLANEEVIELDK
jgi:uncharacterized protein (DUF433 family)